MRQRISFPESTFSADSLSVSVHPLCAIACFNICARDKGPVVHVRVRWIMATQTYPARTISDKNNQLHDCGRSSAMSMLLQHGYIRKLCHHHHHHHQLRKEKTQTLRERESSPHLSQHSLESSLPRQVPTTLTSTRAQLHAGMRDFILFGQPLRLPGHSLSISTA